MHPRSVLFVALATAGITLGSGWVSAQTPKPTAAPARQAALSDALPIPDAPAPKVSKAWVLMDAATGQVLAGDNVDAQVEPASITKVMTSYVIAGEMAAGKIKPTDPVMMSEHAWREVALPPMAVTAALRSTKPRRWWKWKKAWWCNRQ